MKRYKMKFLLPLFAIGILLGGCGVKAPATAVNEAQSGTSQAGNAAENGSAGETNEAAETSAPTISTEGLTPVYGAELKDGVYDITVDSSSSMFRITRCLLTVKNGEMSAVMTMGGTGYLKLYMGTSEQAIAADKESYIPFTEAADGTHTYEVPVEALDMGISCSAFSKKKEKWYDRTLVFRSASLPEEAFAEGRLVTAASLQLADGIYTAEVLLEGGSGRAAVLSPAVLYVNDGAVTADIVWGSANYDYMKVDGVTYNQTNTEGNSAFRIPVSGFDRKLNVIADTIAMSEPHEIEYTLTFDSSTLKKTDTAANTRKMDLLYADQFRVEYDSEGCAMITIQDGNRYLVIPEHVQATDHGQTLEQAQTTEQTQSADHLQATPHPQIPEDVTVIRQPLRNIYLVATSAMDLLCRLDGLDSVTLSGTDTDGWYIKEARQAMEEGRISYAGKYNAPDYELILSKNCDLAIESTMIYHSPEVKEQLENLGIPVFTERSSYESHPLGRMEWIKLYGVLLGKEELAETLFEEKVRQVEAVMAEQPTGKTAAFFYIGSNGSVNVRKSGDYVAKMIELAGGSYVPETIGDNDNSLSTMNMQMEAFYAAAKDADYLIYNSTIDGELKSIDELLAKSSLLADFKAVQDGNVWCTEKSLFQESLGLGDMITDLHKIFTEDHPDPNQMAFLYPLK